MKRPLKVWSADREKRYGIVVDTYENLKIKAAEKLGVIFNNDIRLVLEEDGTLVDESYWEHLKDHTRVMLLEPTDIWRPATLWPPMKNDPNIDFVDGNSGEQLSSEKLFEKLQQNPAIMVLLKLSEMEMIKDADLDEIDGSRINKDMARDLQEKCTDLYLMKKKEQEALEVIDLIKQKKGNALQ